MKIPGTINADKKTVKVTSRQRQVNREKAYAAIAEKNTCPTVMAVATMTELRR
ncbi:hypothetical protein brsh051_19590 [Brooklawnia propionicigenes]|uniref:Uncharacterized protein n=1 Tax=Brooklawnia propionicigenes TaxID=3041175 RepID=A0AAN0KGI8_9ACTN|nr:hypothetical protein brsh051_19590 [Brooklawnia sp. SH051]